MSIETFPLSAEAPRTFNIREALIRWLQIVRTDLDSFGQIQVVKRNFRSKSHMTEFLDHGDPEPIRAEDRKLDFAEPL